MTTQAPARIDRPPHDIVPPWLADRFPLQVCDLPSLEGDPHAHATASSQAPAAVSFARLVLGRSPVRTRRRLGLQAPPRSLL